MLRHKEKSANSKSSISVIFLDKDFAPYRQGMFDHLSKFVDLHLISTTSHVHHWSHFFLRNRKGSILNHFLHAGELLIILLRIRPKVIVSGDFAINTAVALFYGKITGCKVIVWARLTKWSERNRSPLQKTIRKLMCRFSPIFVANGASGESYLKGLGAKKVKIIPQTSSGLDIEELSLPLKYSDRKPQWVFVGRLVKEKGLSEFIEAFSTFSPNSRPNIIVIGEGPFRENLQNRCTQLEVQATFLGWRTKNEINAILDESICLVMPTHCDEWGLVIIESLSRGIPVLGSKYSGAVEELFNPEVPFGIVFDVFERDSVILATSEMINISGDAWERMSETALHTISNKNLVDSETANKFLSLFNSTGK